MINYGLSFNGTSSFIDLGDINTPSNTNNVVVIKARVKFNSLIGHQAIFNDGGYKQGIEFGLYNGELHLAVENSDSHRSIGYDVSNLKSNKWYELEGIADGSSGQMYLKVDGNVVKSDISLNSFTSFDGTDGTKIGYTNQSPSANDYAYDSYFNGIIDEIQIWKEYSLDDPMNKIDGTEEGLFTAWKLNENSGTQINSINNNYSGTLTDCTWVKISESKFLIQDGNDIKTYDFNNSQWNTLGTNTTKGMFINNGMDSLINITFNELSQLTSNTPKILSWSNDLTSTKQNIMKGTPSEQTIIPTGDINIEHVDSFNEVSIEGFTVYSGDLGDLTGDTRKETETFNCSNYNGVEISFYMSNSSMDDGDEYGHLLWYTGTEWKIIKEIQNTSGNYNVDIPSEWLSNNNKIQMDLIAGGSGVIHSDGNGNADYLTVNDIEVKAHDDSSKIAISNDQGVNWYTYNFNTNKWEVIDISNINTDGILAYKIINIPNNKLNELLQDYDIIRLAYYINEDSIIDNLLIDANIKGTWNSTIPGEDYDYQYTYSDQLKIKLFNDGAYKINY
jgi:hypothetical protein